MGKQELVAKIAEKNGLTKRKAQDVVDSFLSITTDVLAKEGRLAIGGFGVFDVVETNARKGRNPQTGEEIQIPASRRVRFKPAKNFKDVITEK